jgi:hypothetical protein
MGSEVDSIEFDRRTQCLSALLGLDSSEPVSVIRQKIAVLSIGDARHLLQAEQRRADSKVGGKRLSHVPQLFSSYGRETRFEKRLWI